MDAGQLEVEDRVPQGWHTYEPATSDKHPGPRSLVVYLHGTTQTATDAALARTVEKLAGMALVGREIIPGDVSVDGGS